MAKVSKDAWMVTFSDLITLMITFFVMLLTMSTLDISRLKEMFSFFPGAGTAFSGGRPKICASRGVLVERLRLASRTGYRNWLDRHDSEAFHALTRWLVDRRLEDKVKVVQREDGFEIHLEHEAMFKPGSTNVNPRLIPFLGEVAGTLKAQPGVRLRVEVVATDRAELAAQKKFRSLWNLAAGRAASVVGVLRKKYGIEGERLSMIGYGDSPVVKEEKIETFKQRVELVFVDSEVL